MQTMLHIFLLIASAHAFSPTAVFNRRPAAAATDATRIVGRTASARMGGGKEGIFTPAVQVTKKVMGEERFTELKYDLIGKHTKVIQAFVDTSVSPVGTIALKKLFQLADMDHNGSIDRDELGAALRKLGFSHLSTKQIDQILNRADKDDNFEIDYDEFVREAPKTLKTNLVKLAKDNGSALGFLA